MAKRLRLSPASRGRLHTRGLTLVELMVVISIMAVLMGAVGVAVFHYLRKGQIEGASIACHRIRTAVQAHFIEHPEDPDCPTPAALKASREIDSTTNLDDPWGSAYRVECSVDEVTASSAGPDRVFGNDDDIRVPGPRRHPPGVATQP